MPSVRRVALITGANRGIGSAIARQLAEHDIYVITAARNAERAHRTAKELRANGLHASGAHLDLTEPDTITAAVNAILNEHGRLDILVNNAGISDGNQRSSNIDLPLTSQVLQVNVLGSWLCANAVIPAMRAAQYGRIVNVSSTLGSLHHMNRSSEPAYRVSKAALNAVTRVLAAELTGSGILVNSVSPGWVRTDLGGPNAPNTIEQGADTPVWLATLPSDGPTGGFFYQRARLEW